MSTKNSRQYVSGCITFINIASNRVKQYEGDYYLKSFQLSKNATSCADKKPLLRINTCGIQNHNTKKMEWLYRCIDTIKGSSSFL